MNLEKELKQFDIDERRGVFERRKFKEVKTFDRNKEIEEETEEDTVFEESKNENVDKQQNTEKLDNEVKSIEEKPKSDVPDSTPIKKPRKRIIRRAIKEPSERNEPPDTTATDSEIE